MIHVYALVDGPSAPPAVPGVGGAPVAIVRAAGLDAVVSRHDAAPAGDPRTDAAAHGLVVEALVASSVLPMRFGEAFAGDEELAAALSGRVPAIRAALARVRGCVELGVRVSAPGRAATGAHSGAEYLRARLAEVTERERLDELLEPEVRASAQASGETVYLVERHRVDGVLDLIRAFAARHPHLSVVPTGPWAPYSFGGDLR